MELFSTSPSLEFDHELLASALGIARRLQIFLAPDSLLLLHRSQWRCLAISYFSVLCILSGFLECALPSLGFSEKSSLWHMLCKPLNALHLALQEGEKCMYECLIPGTCSSALSWLVDKVLPQGTSTDVVDVHLHHLLWTFSVVCEEMSRFGFSDSKLEFSLISSLTTDLCSIWGTVDALDDFRITQSLLRKIKAEEQDDKANCSKLADFVLEKLNYCFRESVTRTIMHGDDDLPSFLWVHSESLLRNADTLGEGGYGKVYEARWLGGRFAVKDFFYVQNNEMFGREATIQAQLRHPNVVPLVCCTKNPSLNKCSLVMELMDQDLQVLMMQRMVDGMDAPFSLTVAVDLMLQIAKGMEYLHSDNLRIIHRDLKSSNILVRFSSRGTTAGGSSQLNRAIDECNFHVHLKVADFGMSKAKHASSRYTSRQRGATPWRAPEVFEANPEDETQQPNAKYTNKADVYSFALVCYEILTGKLPFEGTQIRRRVLAGERPTLPCYCPRALSSFIETCWHADPARRPRFSQICRMLRYFKACFFLQNDVHGNHNQAHQFDWLLQSVPFIMCARIDERVQSLVKRIDPNLQIRSDTILIPLAMYCCREVLSQISRDDTSEEDMISSVVPLTWLGPKMLVSQSSGKFRWFLSMCIDFTRGWMQRFFCFKIKGVDTSIEAISSGDNTSIQRFEIKGVATSIKASAELGFTYAELCTATNNFAASSLIGGAGGSAKFYFGTLVDGQKIAVRRARASHVVGHDLLQELRIEKQARHPNIVSLLGWCTQSEGGELLLVYEYMPNGDLVRHKVRRLLQRLAEAPVSAHGRGSELPAEGRSNSRRRTSVKDSFVNKSKERHSWRKGGQGGGQGQLCKTNQKNTKKCILVAELPPTISKRRFLFWTASLVRCCSKTTNLYTLVTGLGASIWDRSNS